MTKHLKEDLLEYIKESIEHYETRCSLAFDKMYEYRVPLQYADEYLYNDMVDVIADYVSDNDISEQVEEDIFENIEDLMLCEW